MLVLLCYIGIFFSMYFFYLLIILQVQFAFVALYFVHKNLNHQIIPQPYTKIVLISAGVSILAKILQIYYYSLPLFDKLQ